MQMRPATHDQEENAMKRICYKRILALISCCAILLIHLPEIHGAEKAVQVLTTTFPLYQITRNLTAGSDRIKVELMIPAQLGCPHDYALVPQDMQKLARADVLIINGLGMEEFLGAPLQKANPGLKIIDSSKGIGPILHYTAMESEEHGHQDQHGHPAEHDAQHPEEAPNPHLFASPRMAALLAKNIAARLSVIDPDGAQLYAANARAYEQRMNRLADDFTALGKRLKNNRVVTQHGVFDYLARDMGLTVVAVVQAHAGQDPSASEILAIVALIKAKKAGAIFTEPQYPQAIGKTIAKEAGIAAAILDPGATGHEQSPLDQYEQVMRANLATLEKTLGTN
jgi:zinc transport system substrate-binding protein